ncbi:MAG TPA: nucleotidyltransferase domain-containing protein [Anaerolineae bacterium]|nr:nucleotidyltransferase domain-containing protein [Anaerolineae bacterium]
MKQPTIASAVAPDRMTSKFDLPAVDLPGIADCLAHQPDVAAAYVFGSVARGQASHLSDVDIAVLLDPSLEGAAALERQLALVQALEPYARSEIQVVVLNLAAPALAYQVVRDGRLLCERDRAARIAFEVRTMKLYFDLLPMLSASHQALIQRIKEVGLGRTRRRDSGTLDAARRIRERLEESARH